MENIYKYYIELFIIINYLDGMSGPDIGLGPVTLTVHDNGSGQNIGQDLSYKVAPTSPIVQWAPPLLIFGVISL